MSPQENQNSDQSSNTEFKGLICPACHASVKISSSQPKKPPQYCPFCGTLLPPIIHYKEGKGSFSSEGSPLSSLSNQVTLISGHVPADEPIQFVLGSYQVLRSI